MERDKKERERERIKVNVQLRLQVKQAGEEVTDLRLRWSLTNMDLLDKSN